jgi:GDP-mannose pyrophosphatase NudK
MNARAENIKIEILSEGFKTLQNVSFTYVKDNGKTEQKLNEIYSGADGVAVLLINTQKQTVILIKQLRIASLLNGNKTGMLIEACAGLLDEKDPSAGIKREIEEETGYKVPEVKKIFEMYTSPGAITERIHYFIAAYDETMKVSDGGGLDEEKEDIEVLEMPFEEAYNKLMTGEIKDAKTAILLQYAKIEKLFDQ